jgi:threonyl-tRNA synthetase
MQCATIQLDFQLPRRFGLHYVDITGQKRIEELLI